MQQIILSLKARCAVIPKGVIIGVLGVLCMYVGVAGTYSVAAPWMLRGDTKQHVDYVWRVYNGELPKWHDGVTYRPFVDAGLGNVHQAASANPPLFYLLHAPVIGPILESGQWQKAIAAGRALNIGFGVMAGLALAWAGWVYGGKRRALFAVAVPALALLMYRVTRLNTDFALDALLLTFSTLSLVLNYKLIMQGPKARYILSFFALSALGMATKAPYVLFFGINILAILGAYLLHGNPKVRVRSFIRALIVVASAVVIILATVGWYYFRNYKFTGHWYSGSPPGYTGGRAYQSFAQVIHNEQLWATFYGVYARSVEVSTAIMAFAVAGWAHAGATKDAITAFVKDRKKSLTYGLLVLAFVGTFVIQVKFAIGYGSVNFRYMIPVLFPIALFLAYGLLSAGALRGFAVFAAAFAMGASSLYALGNGRLSKIYADVHANGVPDAVLILLLSAFLVGSGLLAHAMLSLTKRTSP